MAINPNRNYQSDPAKWLIRKCGNHWTIWKPGHGVPDFHAATFLDVLARRWVRLNWI